MGRYRLLQDMGMRQWGRTRRCRTQKMMMADAAGVRAVPEEQEPDGMASSWPILDGNAW